MVQRAAVESDQECWHCNQSRAGMSIQRCRLNLPILFLRLTAAATTCCCVTATALLLAACCTCGHVTGPLLLLLRLLLVLRAREESASAGIQQAVGNAAQQCACPAATSQTPADQSAEHSEPAQPPSSCMPLQPTFFFCRCARRFAVRSSSSLCNASCLRWKSSLAFITSQSSSRRSSRSCSRRRDCSRGGTGGR